MLIANIHSLPYAHYITFISLMGIKEEFIFTRLIFILKHPFLHLRG